MHSSGVDLLIKSGLLKLTPQVLESAKSFDKSSIGIIAVLPPLRSRCSTDTCDGANLSPESVRNGHAEHVSLRQVHLKVYQNAVRPRGSTSWKRKPTQSTQSTGARRSVSPFKYTPMRDSTEAWPTSTSEVRGEADVSGTSLGQAANGRGESGRRTTSPNSAHLMACWCRSVILEMNRYDAPAEPRVATRTRGTIRPVLAPHLDRSPARSCTWRSRGDVLVERRPKLPRLLSASMRRFRRRSVWGGRTGVWEWLTGGMDSERLSCAQLKMKKSAPSFRTFVPPSC